MKKLFTAMFALVAGTSVALATDLPSKKAAPAAPVSTDASISGWYVGGNFGGNLNNFSNINLNQTPYTLGATVGYEWNRYLRTEADYNYTSSQAPVTARTGNTLFVNAIAQYGILGTGFTPYVLAGVGEGWGAFGKSVTGDVNTLWNIGGGVRYAINPIWEVDGRYRYVQSFDNKYNFKNNNVVTLGVNYKF
jgi:opacity protein-like surface antigen